MLYEVMICSYPPLWSLLAHHAWMPPFYWSTSPTVSDHTGSPFLCPVEVAGDCDFKAFIDCQNSRDIAKDTVFQLRHQTMGNGGAEHGLVSGINRVMIDDRNRVRVVAKEEFTKVSETSVAMLFGLLMCSEFLSVTHDAIAWQVIAVYLVPGTIGELKCHTSYHVELYSLKLQ